MFYLGKYDKWDFSRLAERCETPGFKLALASPLQQLSCTYLCPYNFFHMNSFSLFKLLCEAPSTTLWHNMWLKSKRKNFLELISLCGYFRHLCSSAFFFYVLRLHLCNFNQILLYDYLHLAGYQFYFVIH